MRVFVVKNIPYSDMAMLYCNILPGGSGSSSGRQAPEAARGGGDCA